MAGMDGSKGKQAESFFKRCDNKLNLLSDEIGNFLVNLFHQIALFAIGAATFWAAMVAFWGMVQAGHATIEDLLLLFIYLEIGAMVGIYFKTNRMPVRFLVYVAITALTRLLISLANHHEKLDGQTVLVISASILLLAGASLVLRYGSTKFASDSNVERSDDDQ
jgi:phosphate starvation-inducible membrane PsiE